MQVHINVKGVSFNGQTNDIWLGNTDQMKAVDIQRASV